MQLGSAFRLAARAVAAVLGSLMLVVAAAAAQTDFGIGYVGEYSSNVGRTPTNPNDEWINSAIAGFTYVENTVDLTARATGQAQYRDYTNDSFADETQYLLDASLLWTISPGRLTWSVEDAFRDVVLDPTRASTPNNRARANALSTGPDVTFRLNPVNTLRLNARYGRVYVADTGLDNDRHSGLLGWEYQSSAVTQWSLNAQQAVTDYENDVVATDFRQSEIYARMQRRYSQSQFTLDAGKTRVKRVNAPAADGSLLRLDWRRSLGAAASFGVALAGEFQDTGAALLGSVSAPAPPTGGTPPPAVGTSVVTGDVYYSRAADVFYSRQGPRIAWTARINGRDLDFETTPQDRREAGVNLDVAYNYSAIASIGIFGQYLRTDFVQAAREDEDTTVGVRFAYRVRRHLGLMLEGLRIERTSTDPLSEFVDKRVLFTVQYTTGPLYAPLPQ